MKKTTQKIAALIAAFSLTFPAYSFADDAAPEPANAPAAESAQAETAEVKTPGPAVISTGTANTIIKPDKSAPAFEMLERIETIIYGSKREGGLLNRLNDVERTIFGRELPGSLTERQTALIDFLERGTDTQPSVLFKLSVAEWGVSQEIHPTWPLTRRIDAMEAILEGANQPGPLVSRLERLLMKLLPEGIMATQFELPKETIAQADYRTISDVNYYAGYAAAATYPSLISTLGYTAESLTGEIKGLLSQTIGETRTEIADDADTPAKTELENAIAEAQSAYDTSEATDYAAVFAALNSLRDAANKYTASALTYSYEQTDYGIRARLNDQYVHLMLYADKTLVRQVLLNLIRNAVQAIDGQTGRIACKAFATADDHVVIQVSNDGPVIPEAERAHAFTPFFTTKRQGSGLGLSVCRQIMTASQGTIALLPPGAQGWNTTFVLDFA